MCGNRGPCKVAVLPLYPLPRTGGDITIVRRCPTFAIGRSTIDRTAETPSVATVGV